MTLPAGIANLHELTGAGKNICPNCEKPEPVVTMELNLIQALEHLEAIGHDGIKDRIWDCLLKNYDVRNDSGFYLSMPDESERDEYENQEWEDFQLFKNTWDIDDGIQVWVSW